MDCSAQQHCKCIDPSLLKPSRDVFDPQGWRLYILGVCLCVCVCMCCLGNEGHFECSLLGASAETISQLID